MRMSMQNHSNSQETGGRRGSKDRADQHGGVGQAPWGWLEEEEELGDPGSQDEPMKQPQ